MEFYVIDNYWNRNYKIISSNDELNDAKHGEGRCFHACSRCNECLAGKEVVHQNNKTYCWKCYETFFGLRCVSCLEIITGLYQVSFIYYNNQVWHKKCFHCSSCRISLEGQEFKQEGRFAYCKRCRF